jgi:hypothetical protein
MDIGRQINFSVYGAVRHYNTLDVSVYDEIDDMVYGSVWDIFDGGLITSVEREIWDYEYR